MGFLRDLGKTIGKVGKIAAPVLAATGVGAPAAMAIMAGSTLAGKAAQKGGLKKMKVFKEGVLPTAAVGAGAHLMKGAGGIQGIISKNAGLRKALGISGGKDGKVGGLEALLGIGKKVGGAALRNPKLLAGGVAAVAGAKKQAKAGRRRDQAVDLAMQDYQKRNTVRDAVLQKLLADPPAGRDLSSVYKTGGAY